jgi:DNA polymerase-4
MGRDTQNNTINDAIAFPTAMVHFDGDSFFASVEQTLDHTLRWKPVMTGSERGVITSLSIEAKRRGLRRGMSLREIRVICPEAFFVPSNYTAYSIYARRMYAIVRRFTPLVHEYSIDECFADITGLDERYHESYESIALRIKAALEECLGITFGVGLAPNKLLAKIASKHRKPAGFTMIPMDGITQFLAELPIGKVWGIGSSMSVYFGRLGIRTTLDFARKDRYWIEDASLSKPYRQMWYELQGHCIHGISEDAGDDTPGSIMKTHTFSPPSRSRAFVISQLSKNIEKACEAARAHDVRARAITFYLKTQEFTYHRIELDLMAATNNPADILAAVIARFDDIFASGILYRATGITLREIVAVGQVAPDLFGISRASEEAVPVLNSIDMMNHKYGRATVFLASSMQALAQNNQPSRNNDRVGKDRGGKRLSPIMSLEHRRHTLDLPFLGAAR